MSEETENGALRVAIMCNGARWQFWQERVFDELQRVPQLEVVLLIQPKEGRTNERSLPVRLATASWGTLLYRRYRQKGLGSTAMKRVNMTQPLLQIPSLKCAVTVKKQAEYFSAEDMHAIKRYQLDVVIRLGFNIIKGDILDCAKHGIWSFHHGDEEKYRGGPPALWEIMNGEKTMGVILQRLTEKLDGGFILKKGCYKLSDHSLSDSIDAAMIDSAIWPAQLCRRLIRGQLDAAQGYKSQAHGKIYKYPNNLQYLRLRVKLWRNKIRFHQEELNKHEEWNIGVLNYPISECLKQRPNQNVRWLPNPAKGSYRADPFGFLHNEELVVLYEKYDGKKGRGVIARLRPKPDNVLKRSKTILDNVQHLSYPYVVQRNGKTYVIPESFSSGQVTLYELSEDMDSMEPRGVMLDEPLGGTPFMHEGQLYRPAQDSSETYGGRLVINRVVQLDTHDYREEFVKCIEPLPGGPHKAGIHTISAVGPNFTLVDGKRFITDQNKRRATLKRKINKLLGR